MSKQQAERLIDQSGSTLDAQNVTLSSNRTGERDRIVEFELPRRFQRLALDTDIHETKFIPRTMDEKSVTGTTTSVSADLQPVNGETDISRQAYPVVVAYDTTAGAQLDIASVDYAQNQVTLVSDPAGNTVKFYSVMTEGNIFYRVVDAFDTPVSSLDKFGTSVRAFSQLELNNKRNRPHLEGSAVISGNESLELMIDAPQKITWEDPDYPEGEYVTQLNQRVVVDTGN